MEKPTRNKILIGAAIILTLGIAWVGWKYWGWFSGKDWKQKRCARKTGFNLEDLDPQATTTTMGMHRREFEICMGTAQKEGERCRTYHPEDAFSTYSSSPPLDGTIKNGKCIGEEGASCSLPNNKTLTPDGKWKNGECVANADESEGQRSFAVGGKLSGVNCKQTKVINGVTYVLTGIAVQSNKNWLAIYGATISGYHEKYFPITPQQAKEYSTKCGY